MKDFLRSPEPIKKSICRYIFHHTLHNIFPIASYSFKDICYESNLLDLIVFLTSLLVLTPEF